MVALTETPSFAADINHRLKAYRTYFSILGVDTDSSTVTIQETIPTSRSIEFGERSGFQTTAVFKYNKNQRRLKVVSLKQNDGAINLIAHNSNFVDFIMPKELEGHSLILSHEKPLIQPVLPSVAKTWRRFETSVLSTILILQTGKYENPIDTIIAQQGDSLMPPMYRQTLLLGLEVSNPEEGSFKQLVYLYFQVYNNQSKTFTAKANVAELNLDITLNFRFTGLNERANLTLDIERGDDQRETMTYEVDGEFLFDMNRVGAPGFLHLTKREANDPHQLALDLQSTDVKPWLSVYPVLVSSSQVITNDCISLLKN